MGYRLTEAERIQRERARFERQLEREEERYQRQLEREEERYQRQLEREEERRPKSITECFELNAASYNLKHTLVSPKKIEETIDECVNKALEACKKPKPFIQMCWCIAFSCMALNKFLMDRTVIGVIFSIAAAIFLFMYLAKKGEKIMLKDAYDRKASLKDNVKLSVVSKLIDYNDAVKVVYTGVKDVVDGINTDINKFIDNAQELVGMLEMHYETLSVKTFDFESCQEILDAWKETQGCVADISHKELKVYDILDALPQKPVLTDDELVLVEPSLLSFDEIIYRKQTYFNEIATRAEIEAVTQIFDQLFNYYYADTVNSEVVKKIKSLEKKAVTALKKCYHDSNTKLKDM